MSASPPLTEESILPPATGSLPIPEGVDDNEFSIHDMYDPRSKYSAEEKMAAAMAFVMTGNSKKASKVCGIPDATLRWWKASAIWWPGAVQKCKKDKSESIDAAMTEAIDIGMENIIDMLQNGEYIISKAGKVIRKKATLQHTTTAIAILQDKRQIIRGEPTNITEKKSTSQKISELGTKFEEFSKGMKDGRKQIK